ncbi:MAG: T9SS type A sorting domain-containing protein [Ignavibacteriae bacterium]|nr:T9SS type A sorting domain-containing protein [Ignavibacteriota bacterium]MCB9214658.1 T9SS type A sorting domain-containing protein [Ignavibacteria bacterium]
MLTPFPTNYRPLSSILFLALLCSSYQLAKAQPFEYLYGATTDRENAYAGTALVTNCAGGGYIAIGSRFPTSGGNADVYVVRTRANGTVIWAYLYDLINPVTQTSANDRGSSIVELPSGGFVLTGYTDVNGNDDVLLMHIDCNGQITPGTNLVSTYGSTAVDGGLDIAFSPISPNSVIICGETYGGLTGTQDGLLMRVDYTTGALAFMRAYDNNGRDDILRGVIETSAAGPGDIVATGSSFDQTTAQDDGWMLRTNLFGAILAAPPYGSAIIGGSLNDHLNKVVERQTPPSQGNLVFIGELKSGMANSVSDIWLVETSAADICNVLLNRNIGDDASSPNVYEDYGLDIVEASTVYPYFNVNIGDYIITGTTTYGHSPGEYEGFILPISSGLVPLGTGSLFGDHATNIDITFSIDEIPNGFILGGWSEYHPMDPTDPRDLYQVATNGAGHTCCDDLWNPTSGQPILSAICGPVTTRNLNPSGEPDYNRIQWTMATEACTTQCVFPKRALETGDDDLSIRENPRAFPNPVVRGGEITLQYNDLVEESGNVSVVNSLGEKIYTNEIEIVNGSLSIPLQTKDWPSGTYIVEITAGIDKDVVQLIVVE